MISYGYQGQMQQAPQQQPRYGASAYHAISGGIGSNISAYRERLKAMGLEDSIIDKMLGSEQDFLKEYSPKALIAKGISSMIGGGASAAGGAAAGGAAASGIGGALSAL